MNSNLKGFKKPEADAVQNNKHLQSFFRKPIAFRNLQAGLKVLNVLAFITDFFTRVADRFSVPALQPFFDRGQSTEELEAFIFEYGYYLRGKEQIDDIMVGSMFIP